MILSLFNQFANNVLTLSFYSIMVNKEELLDRLLRLKRSIKNDPTVLGRYDINEDGKISGKEWDLARKETILCLESENASAQIDKKQETAETVLKNIDGKWKVHLDIFNTSIPLEEK